MKTKEQARANLEGSLSYIPQRFKEGVEAADWATPAGSEQAEKNFATGIGKAVAAKSRQTGVKKVSNTTWQGKTVDKGAAVIEERIRAALPTWEREWGPKYDQVVSKVKALPASTTDFRANINARLVPVVETWKKAAGKL